MFLSDFWALILPAPKLLNISDGLSVSKYSFLGDLYFMLAKISVLNCIECVLAVYIKTNKKKYIYIYCIYTHWPLYNVHLARDGILHTLVVMSGYLNYCCRSIISNQSAHSLLTSDINNFQPHNCRSLDIFSFLDPSL